MVESVVTIVVLVAFVALVVANTHAKARAFENGRAELAAHRPPEAVTTVDLPAPRFNRKDPQSRRGKQS